ncbi:MAG: DUF1587 domain-containing protein, partial [Phycisphaerae bacterium]|nr:DUF1587 domain-containing protein [Phycisphaerae bacterium]
MRWLAAVSLVLLLTGLPSIDKLAVIDELYIVAAAQAQKSVVPEPARAEPLGVKGDALEQFESFCIDCHDSDIQKGGMNLVALLERAGADRAIVFEKLITGKMPPKTKDQPGAEQKRAMLAWLAASQEGAAPKAHRRISRHEFVRSVNDLLGVEHDVVDAIPEDRDTHDFDSNRKILLTRQQMTAYFSAADAMLDFALPDDGFVPEQTWVTSEVKESHETYTPYVRKYKQGLLFSWTRVNNGNSYSYFYDKFDPPAEGWYDLTFDVAKLGDFKEDLSVLVFAGRYYIADDRPQPQRLLGVISVNHRDLKPRTIRAFLRPGESVSVHCYSKHTWRLKKGERGAYIEKLTVQGPVFEAWPPKPYRAVFAGLALKDQSTPQRRKVVVASSRGEDLKRVIRAFAERAFSSALNDESLEPYQRVALDHLAEHGDFVRAAKAGLKAVVCSHRFLLAPGFHSNRS